MAREIISGSQVSPREDRRLSFARRPSRFDSIAALFRAEMPDRRHQPSFWAPTSFCPSKTSLAQIGRPQFPASDALSASITAMPNEGIIPLTNNFARRVTRQRFCLSSGSHSGNSKGHCPIAVAKFTREIPHTRERTFAHWTFLLFDHIAGSWIRFSTAWANASTLVTSEKSARLMMVARFWK